MNPFSLAWQAIRKNLLPGLVLQILMIALLVAWFINPPTRHVLEVIAQWKKNFGYLFSAAAAAAAAGVLPEILRILFFQRGRFHRRNFSNLLFGIIYWACMGLMIDAFYRCQALFFGNASDVRTVIIKVCVDMILFTPLVACPLAVVCYRWRDRNFDFSSFLDVGKAGFYRRAILPVLVANWVVWIPVVCVIYAMPPALQVPFFVIAEIFWVLLLTTMSELQLLREKADHLRHAAENNSRVL